jgi:hypothetical protein
MVTFIDPSKVRKKCDFGRCYRRAGWKVCGKTKGGLLALRIAPEAIPPTTLPPLEEVISSGADLLLLSIST